MTPSFRLHLAAATAVALAAGCAPAAPPPTHAEAVTAANCRARADQVYTLRHPEKIYNDDLFAASTRDAPFATSGTIGVTTKGLSGQYEHDQLLGDCLNSGGAVGPTPAAPVEPAETTR
jgi:hypothetical protein